MRKPFLWGKIEECVVKIRHVIKRDCPVLTGMMDSSNLGKSRERRGIKKGAPIALCNQRCARKNGSKD